MSNVAQDVIWPTLDENVVVRAVFLYVGQGDATIFMIKDGDGFRVVLVDINRDENGTLITTNTQVFTGITRNGDTVPDRYFGTTTLSNGSLRVTRGLTNPNNQDRWAQQFNNSPTSTLRFYGLSDPLTIRDAVAIPEPSTSLLGALGAITLLLRRRR